MQLHVPKQVTGPMATDLETICRGIPVSVCRDPLASTGDTQLLMQGHHHALGTIKCNSKPSHVIPTAHIHHDFLALTTQPASNMSSCTAHFQQWPCPSS